jgi:7-cyano-7-deazaguanine synthase in queuosine biosynthesis
MSNPHLLLCNSATLSTQSRQWTAMPPQELWTSGRKKNVTLEITDITDRMAEPLPEVVEDLVELAALVYAADQFCKRTGPKSFDYGDKWHRTFRFEVAVRRPDFWRQHEVLDALIEMLSFLSDDDYEFAFSKWKNPPAFSGYLDFKKNSPLPSPPERVMLFSGGLDSLAGAVDEVLVNRRRVAMVSHKPVDHLAVKQRALVAAIAKRAGEPHLAPRHVPVKANKDGEREPEYTQRSRSFLYAALAAAVARLFDLDRIYFYENGILSVNLPLCAQEVGGRATRTTHPQVLHGFARLFSLVLGFPFAVENDYFWLTKQDVLDQMKRAGHADLAAMSLSCTHTRNFTLVKPHCGLCSQCISRRVAALGADYGDNDPALGYRDDVLTAPRKKDEERIVAERFVGTARQVEAMTNFRQFHQRFAGELSRITSYLPLSSSDAVARIFELHHHHATQVGQTMLSQMRIYLEDFRLGRLPDTSLIGYAFSQGFVSADRAAAGATASDATSIKPKVAQELVDGMRTFLKKHAGRTFSAKELNQEMQESGLTTRAYHPSDISAAKRYLAEVEHLPLVGRSYRYEEQKDSA